MSYSVPVRWAVILGSLGFFVACGEQEPASAPAPPPAASSMAKASAAATATAKADAPPDAQQQQQPNEGGPGSIGGVPPVQAPLPAPAQGEPMRLAAVANLAEGKLSRDQVQQTIDSAADTLAKCLVTETRVSVKIDVAASGEVSASSVASSDPDDPKVRDCVAATIKGLRFPPPEGREPLSLSMSLVLKPRVSL